MQWLLTFMGLWDPMELLTVGLVLFAGAQVFVQERTEYRRKLERKADDARSTDIAFQTAWAEQFRIEGLADEWEAYDLVEESALGVLDPEDVLPTDWSVMMAALTRLGVESGHLGAVALSLGRDTARMVAKLNAVVQDVQHQFPHASAESVVKLVRDGRKVQAEGIQAEIRSMTRDLSLVLWDAIRHSERANLDRTMHFRDDLLSESARGAVSAVKQRERHSDRLANPSAKREAHNSLLVRRLQAMFSVVPINRLINRLFRRSTR